MLPTSAAVTPLCTALAPIAKGYAALGGAGFQVASEGRALNQGSEGEVIQVRLTSGQVVSGIARASGVVEVGF